MKYNKKSRILKLDKQDFRIYIFVKRSRKKNSVITKVIDKVVRFIDNHSVWI